MLLKKKRIIRASISPHCLGLLMKFAFRFPLNTKQTLSLVAVFVLAFIISFLISGGTGKIQRALQAEEIGRKNKVYNDMKAREASGVSANTEISESAVASKIEEEPWPEDNAVSEEIPLDSGKSPTVDDDSIVNEELPAETVEVVEESVVSAPVENVSEIPSAEVVDTIPVETASEDDSSNDVEPKEAVVSGDFSSEDQAFVGKDTSEVQVENAADNTSKDWSEYTVVPGDTWTKLSRRYDVSVEELRENST